MKVMISTAERMQWIKLPEGAPPGAAIGGAFRLAHRVVAYISVVLAPGKYALSGLAPKLTDGTAHDVHGMFTALTVT